MSTRKWVGTMGTRCECGDTPTQHVALVYTNEFEGVTDYADIYLCADHIVTETGSWDAQSNLDFVDMEREYEEFVPEGMELMEIVVTDIVPTHVAHSVTRLND